jgi:hypothetical protein
MLALAALVGCGSSSNNSSEDLAKSEDLKGFEMDLSAEIDGGKMVTPYNMPGEIDCYSGPKCSTTSSTPICCDAPADGGFSDTCVASVAACTATGSSATPYQCGQAADCTGGMLCCANTKTSSSSGKTLFKSTVCAASCPSPEIQLCVTAAECKTGTQCVGQSIEGRDVGVCQ